MRRGVSTALVLVGVAAAALLLLGVGAILAARRPILPLECVRMYGLARTAADTARVDSLAPRGTDELCGRARMERVSVEGGK